MPPTVMTQGKTNMAKKALNAFSQLAKVSILEQLKRTGWPCFVLDGQHRIVNGGFDVARDATYKETAGVSWD